MQAAARSLRLRLDTMEVQSPADLKRTVARIARMRTDGIQVSSGQVLTTARQQIVDFAAKHRIPVIYDDTIFIEAGGLMFYGSPYVELLRYGAGILKKALKGIKSADIP